MITVLCTLACVAALIVGAWAIESRIEAAVRRDRARGRRPAGRHARPRIPAPRWPLDGR